MYYAQKKPGRAVWYVWHEVRGIVVEVWMGSRAECEQRAADLNAGRI